MRGLPNYILSVTALMAMALPAMADRLAMTQPIARNHGIVVSRPSMTPMFRFNDELFVNRTFPGVNDGRFDRPFRNRFGSSGPALTGGVFGSLDTLDQPPAFIAPIFIAPPAAPARPSRPAFDERPTVETTVSGVEIVRGPGTRHTFR